ncbi:MAG: gliding motility-associated ABC transporter permease subunit GldF [Saprospiraceae bacterium]|nr:gliding motility-associated ABC transporter permease subunit GldF [Saprospiraceae bacterium]
MLSIFWKEINAFFSSLIAYLVIVVFLVLNGLFMWVFTDSSILDYNYASMDPLFSLAPFVLLILIPAITMRSFAEERQRGTIEFLYTKPLSDYAIILGKYLANLCLVVFALLPTVVYYYSVYQLGSPVGNLDTGAIIGSYIGLFFLSASFVAIGMFASALTDNQIVAFILGAFLCFVVHWAFDYLASMPAFIGNIDAFVDRLGIQSHYDAMSKGAIDTRDLVYFLGLIAIFITACHATITGKK